MTAGFRSEHRFRSQTRPPASLRRPVASALRGFGTAPGSARCRISAPHQNGPIGEGRIIDGCVTCPWHGYQYRLEDGCAPAPFTEKLATYRVRVARGLVEVDPRPLAPGTPAAIRYE